MGACVALCVALAATAGCRDHDSPRLLRFGPDLSCGVLVNLTPGAAPLEAIDPGRPTLVFIHGMNLAPRIVHFTMAERFAEAVARRGGPPLNVLGWDWNGATFAGLSARANEGAAIAQGQMLAAALLQAGVAPGQVHLIGHSSGGMVAASAARSLMSSSGQAIAQLTLLDPAALYHDHVFEHLAAGSAARRVENYWAPAPSGYGRHVLHPGVWNARIDGPTPYLGLVSPWHSSHFHIVHWYVGTAADPALPGGFNTSLVLGGGS